MRDPERSGALRGSERKGPARRDAVGRHRDAPVSGIQLLAAGGDQTCAAKGTSSGGLVDDYLQCWGDSFGAQWRMDEPTTTPQIPRRDVDRATVEAAAELLAVGPRFACARNKTEAVECLGVNEAGQLGGVLLEPARTVVVPLVSAPVPVATALAAGGAHACAVLADAVLGDGGPIRCWGSNAAGQLGDGTLADPGTGNLATPLGWQGRVPDRAVARCRERWDDAPRQRRTCGASRAAYPGCGVVSRCVSVPARRGERARVPP